MSDIVVLGAGLVGLQTAILLAEDGHEVTVLERDPSLPPLRVDRAWSGWSRPGVRQFGLPHFLLARWRSEAEVALPGVTEALAELGALRANAFEHHPARRGPLQAGDEQFEVLTARRPVIELAAARAAAMTRGLTVRRGAAARGITGTHRSGTFHVTGVTVDGGTLPADLVVDCGGRQSAMPRLLAAAGGPTVVETREDVGFRYYARHYRGRDGRVPPSWGATVSHHDSLSILTLAADNGTWAVVLTTSSEDRELRSLRDTAVWERVVRRYPRLAPWIDAEPLEDVQVLTSLEDRHRAYVTDSRPVVTGVVPVGDAWACTNPSLGRGVTMGLLQAIALRAAVRTTAAAGSEALVRAYAAATDAVVEPIRRSTMAIDAHRICELRSDRAGMRYVSDDPAWTLSKALFATAGHDDDTLRAALAIAHLLAPPEVALAAPGLMERIIEVGGRPDGGPSGPTRVELLAAIGHTTAA